MSNSQWCPINRSAEIIGDGWSLLILRELMSGSQRFKTLKENISGISMDQLTRKLDHLCRLQIIVRQEFSEAPPRVEYQLTERGRSFMPVLRRIFFWAHQNIWDNPQAGEQVDILLTLRLMCSFSGHGEGKVEVRLCHSGRTDCYLVERDEGQRVFVRLISGDEAVRLKGVQCVATLNQRDWVRFVAQREFPRKEKIWGRCEGDAGALKKLLPVFENLEFEKSFIDAVKKQEALQRDL